MTKLFDVIITDLQSSTKNFHPLLGVGILFALMGHFFVVEPYFQYKAQERKEQKAVIDGENNLEPLSIQLGKFHRWYSKYRFNPFFLFSVSFKSLDLYMN